MKKIGEGQTAQVFSDGEFAYKHYHESYDSRNIHYEVRVQNEIFNNTNLHVAKYEIEDHTIKMTLFEGVIFADRIREEKYKNWLSDFVDLQSEIYMYENLNLLDSFEIFTEQIKKSKLDKNLKIKALESIETIEKKQTLCHFDFHPLNIIYRNNQYYIIDWTNAKMGNPVMDVASTYIIFRQYLKRQANKYLKMMIKKNNFKMSEILQAIPVMAFIKLRENQEEAHEKLLVDLILGNDIIFHRD